MASHASTSSRHHPASLVDPATHSPALMQLVDIRITRTVVDYVVDCVAETVDFAMGRTPASARSRRPASPYTAPFTSFVSTILTRAEVTPSTLLVALSYTARARPHLSIALEEWALERVFLGALIAAAKYTNDSTLKNVHWALCTGVFGKRDVGRIEREFLDVLDWELAVREADLLAHHQGLMEAAAAAPVRVHRKVPAVPVRTHTRQNSAGSTSTTSSSSSSLVVPELTHSSAYSPSSSSSSSDSLRSLSPDVPMDASPAFHSTNPKYALEPVPASASAPGKFHDLLRAFPMPVPARTRLGVH